MAFRHNLAACGALALAVLAGCGQNQSGSGDAASGSKAGTSAAGGKKLTIAVMPKLVGIDYFNAVKKGAEEAAKELGVELIYDGPTGGDVTKQAEMLDTWIARKVDVIAVAPNDPHALAPTLRKAQQRGIKVITYDSDSDADSRSYFVNQATGESIAQSLVDVLASEIGNQGEIAFVIGSMTADNQVTWVKHMNAQIASKYPGLKVIATKPTEEDQQLAVQVAQDIVKANPNLKGIIATTSVALPGSALGLEQAGAAGKVALTGLSTPKSMKKFVENGTVKTFVLWSPVDLGYVTVHAGKALADGAKIGATFSAGRIKDMQTSGSEIVLGPPTRFTKENIGQYDF
jgi:rhamnose transport system substrate-binding protein